MLLTIVVNYVQFVNERYVQFLNELEYRFFKGLSRWIKTVSVPFSFYRK
jgi:hypothetical protein